MLWPRGTPFGAYIVLWYGVRVEVHSFLPEFELLLQKNDLVIILKYFQIT